MLRAQLLINGQLLLRLLLLPGMHVGLPQAIVRHAELRIQLERQNRMQLPSVGEYARIWGLNQARAKLLKPGAIIMHPGPMNRGVEIDPEVADGPHSVILDQVSNGVMIRMAVLASVCNPEGLIDWLKKGGHSV